MSSQLDSTSAILGEYMLKGWTLTDLHCDACRVTPLMREPSSAAEREGRDRIQFCALCDGEPAAPTRATSAPVSSTLREVRAGPSSGSDDAASSISALLLQGYSLLGTNCPNETCRGIPLVGYPRKKDGGKDLRRMCVGCGGRWVHGGDLGGMKLVAVEGSEVAAGKDKRQAEGEGSESPRSRRRREMYGIDEVGGKGKGSGARPDGIEDVDDDDDELDEMDVDDGRQYPMAKATEAPASLSSPDNP